MEKKFTKTSRNFQRNIWRNSFSFFMPKQQPCPQSKFLKIAFLPSSFSDKMRWKRGWPKQLYVLFIIKTWNFAERDFSKDLTDPGFFSTISQFKMYIVTFIAKTFITIVNRKTLFLFIKRLIQYMKTHLIILFSAIIHSVIIGIKWLWVFKN